MYLISDLLILKQLNNTVNTSFLSRSVNTELVKEYTEYIFRVRFVNTETVK